MAKKTLTKGSNSNQQVLKWVAGILIVVLIAIAIFWVLTAFAGRRWT